MLFIQAEKLEAQGIACQTVSRLTFQGKQYESGPAFSKRLRQAVVDFCEEEEDVNCLIVEGPFQFTIWRPVKSSKPSEETDMSSNTSATRSIRDQPPQPETPARRSQFSTHQKVAFGQSNAMHNASTSQELALGMSHQTQVSTPYLDRDDNPPPPQDNIGDQQEKKRRMYRGREY